MLKIRKKRLVVSALVATGLVVPAAAFAVGNLARTNDSYAATYSTDKEAAAHSNFGSEPDLNLWTCVVRWHHDPQNGAALTGDDRDLLKNSLSSSELASIKKLVCDPGDSTSSYDPTQYQIKDTYGIQQLTGLEHLDLSRNAFTDFDARVFNNLKVLKIRKSPKLTSVLFGGMTSLTEVALDGDTGLTSVTAVGDTSLTSLNVSGLTAMTLLQINETALTSIDISTNTALKNLQANDSKLTGTVDLSANTNLLYAGLANNRLTGVTLPTTCKLNALNVRNNSGLSSITNIKKCSSMKSLAINNDNFSSDTINEFLPSLSNLEALKASGNNGLKNNADNPINITSNKSLKNIQLGASTDAEIYVTVDDVSPVQVSGGFEYDFSDYHFVDSTAVSFVNRDGYTASGTKINLTNYDSTDGYAQVKQNPDPYNYNECREDNYLCNDSENTYFKNNYRVLLAKPDTPQQFTITYDGNADDVTGVPSATICTERETCKVSSDRPTREGNEFAGWATEADGGVEYQPGATINNPANMTLYAKWTVKTTPTAYGITFDNNGGSGAPSGKVTCSDADDCKVTIDSYPMEWTDHDFLGWSTNPNATTSMSDYDPGKTVPLDNDITLYAVWKDKDAPDPEPEPEQKTKFVLSFNTNGGTSINSLNCETTTDSCTIKLKASDTTPVKKGFKFTGWSEEPNGSVKYQAGVDATVPMTEAKTLYAQYTENAEGVTTFVTTFDANEGEGAPNPISCDTEVGGTSCKQNLPDTKPTRTGYDFLGWATDKKAEKAQYTAGQEDVPVTGDMTLYAVWKQKSSSDKESTDGGKATAGGIATPDTGASTQGGNSALATVLTAAPIIALGALIGTKFYRGRKSHIKLD